MLDAELVVPKTTVLEADIVVQKPTVLEADIVVQNPTTLDAELVVPKPTVLEADIVVPKTTVLEADIVVQKPTVLDAELVVPKTTVLEGEIVVPKTTVLEGEIVVQKPTVLDAELAVSKPTVLEGEIVVSELVVPKPTVLEGELVISTKEEIVPSKSDIDYPKEITYVVDDYIDDSGKRRKITNQIQLNLRQYTYRIVMDNEDKTEFVLTETNAINNIADGRNGKQVSHILFVKVKDKNTLQSDPTDTLEISFLFNKSSLTKTTYGVPPGPFAKDVDYSHLVYYDVQPIVTIPPYITGDISATQKRQELIHQNNTRLSIDDIDEIRRIYPELPNDSGFVITKIEKMKELYDADIHAFNSICERPSLDVKEFKVDIAYFIRKYLEMVSTSSTSENKTNNPNQVNGSTSSPKTITTKIKTNNTN